MTDSTTTLADLGQALIAAEEKEETAQVAKASLPLALVGAGLVGAGWFVSPSGSTIQQVLIVAGCFVGILGVCGLLSCVIPLDEDEEEQGLEDETAVEAMLRDLDTAPPVLRDLVRRVLAGYDSLSDLMQGTEERLAGIDMDEHLPKARKQALAYVARAHKLATVGALLDRHAAEGDLSVSERHVRDLYRGHCKELERGAQLFEHAEVALSRAVLAADDAPKTADDLGDPLKDMTDTFDALGETLESLRELPDLDSLQSADEQPVDEAPPPRQRQPQKTL